MPAPLGVAVRALADQHHAHCSHTVRNGTEQSDSHDVFDAQVFDQLRQPKTNAIQTHDEEEVQTRQHQHLRIFKSLTNRHVHLCFLLCRDVGLQDVFFSRAEPFGLRNGVIQIKENNNAHQYAG